MFGPLGFNEIIFILVLGFLLLGPRQLAIFSRTFGEMLGRFYRATADARRLFEEERRKLEADMSEVTAPMRQAKDSLRSLRGELQKDVAEVESEVKREKSYFERRQTELRQDWSRRKFLGDLDDEPADSGSVAGAETQAVPEIRSPQGQMARGGLTDVSADAPAAEPASAESPVKPTATTPTATTPSTKTSNATGASSTGQADPEIDADAVVSS